MSQREDHAVPAYVRRCLKNCLHIVVMSYLVLSWIVCVNKSRVFKRILTLAYVFTVCCLNVLRLSFVTVKMTGNGCSGARIAGAGIPSSVTCDLVLFSLL